MGPMQVAGIVGVAGASGAVARYLLGRMISNRVTGRFPVGTLLINLFGAFLIGLLAALVSEQLLSHTWQLVLATGFLGGFTTYSTLYWETYQLFRKREHVHGHLYLWGSYVGGLLLVSCGLFLGRLLV